MSRQLEQLSEERTKREHQAVLHAVYGGLDEAVRTSGGALVGFSARLASGDCLLTLRAIFEGQAMIAFVGGEDLSASLRKAVREIHTDVLSWREDKYAKK
jgi:hypothetical protein